jgi:hypothetical protein
MGAIELFGERYLHADREADGRSCRVASWGLGVLSPEECALYLGSSQIGRIAVSIGALPAIFPVNYLAVTGAIWFRTSSDGTLLRASLGSVVAFEADGFDDIGAFGWSVLVRGVANEINDPRTLKAVKSCFIDAWPLIGASDRFIVIPATLLTGQRYASSRKA